MFDNDILYSVALPPVGPKMFVSTLGHIFRMFNNLLFSTDRNAGSKGMFKDKFHKQSSEWQIPTDIKHAREGNIIAVLEQRRQYHHEPSLFRQDKDRFTAGVSCRKLLHQHMLTLCSGTQSEVYDGFKQWRSPPPGEWSAIWSLSILFSVVWDYSKGFLPHNIDKDIIYFFNVMPPGGQSWIQNFYWYASNTGWSVTKMQQYCFLFLLCWND